MLAQKAVALLDPKHRRGEIAYKMMDSLGEISAWYAAQKPGDQMRWKHPNTIAKHCPKNLLWQPGHNVPKKTVVKWSTGKQLITSVISTSGGVSDGEVKDGRVKERSLKLLSIRDNLGLT